MSDIDTTLGEAVGSCSFACELNDIAKNTEHMCVLSTELEQNLLPNSAGLGSTKDLSATEKAKSLADLGISPFWIEHVLNGTYPKMDDRQRRKLIEEAVEEIIRQITDELVHSYRPRNGF